MRVANVYQHDVLAGTLEELEDGGYRFQYLEGYTGEPVSFVMPVTQRVYEYEKFPAVFEGLLPEGVMLEGFLKRKKIDRDDLFSQLIAVGEDVVGSLRIELQR